MGNELDLSTGMLDYLQERYVGLGVGGVNIETLFGILLSWLFFGAHGWKETHLSFMRVHTRHIMFWLGYLPSLTLA